MTVITRRPNLPQRGEPYARLIRNARVLEGVRSIVAVGMSYAMPEPPSDDEAALAGWLVGGGNMRWPTILATYLLGVPGAVWAGCLLIAAARGSRLEALRI